MLVNSYNYPLVSVIINCYNGETYLAEAVKSVLLQTYKNFEIIFWDNQSTDSSAFIYKSFKDKRLKYYYSKKHTSLYEARNLAIKKSKGKFIAFLDSDDYWFKNKLSSQIKKINNKKIALVYSNYCILNQITGLKKIAYKNKLPEGIIYKELLKDYFIAIGTVLMKKNIYLKSKKLFNNKFNIIGDFDFFLRLSKDNHYDCIQHPLSIYRIHKDSFSNKNRQMYINELKLWTKKKNIFNQNLLFFVKQKIIYMEAIVCILNKEYILTIKKIFKIYSLKKKIKLIMFLLIPNFIFQKLKNNFS
jgi:glycosyltransferase involved in cell wall biosynthesis